MIRYFCRPVYSLLVVLTMVGAVVLCAPSVSAESLSETVAHALQQHPAVEGAKAGVSVAEEERAEEFSGYFPTLSATATGGRMYGDNATSRGLSVTRGDGYSYLWEGNLTVRQMIFDGLETPSRVDSAESRKSSARMTLRDTREQLALRATQAYVNLLRTQKALSMIRAQKAKADDYVKRIGSMVNEGAADETELQQARDVQMTLQGLLVDYTGQARNALADYREAVGRPPEGDLAAPHIDMGGVPTKLTEAIDYALDTHPALKAASYTASSARHDIRAEKASLYPDLNGELTYLKSDKDDIIGGEVIDAKAVLRMNWNFETGGGQLARIRKSKYQLRESEAQKHETQRQIERAVRVAYTEYDTAIDQLDTLAERVALNEKLFKAYENQFEGARINLLQLMQGDNQLFSTRLEEVNARYRVMAAQFGILASLGQLQSSVVTSAADKVNGGEAKVKPAGTTQNGQ